MADNRHNTAIFCVFVWIMIQSVQAASSNDSSTFVNSTIATSIDGSISPSSTTDTLSSTKDSNATASQSLSLQASLSSNTNTVISFLTEYLSPSVVNQTVQTASSTNTIVASSPAQEDLSTVNINLNLSKTLNGSVSTSNTSSVLLKISSTSSSVQLTSTTSNGSVSSSTPGLSHSPGISSTPALSSPSTPSGLGSRNSSTSVLPSSNQTVVQTSVDGKFSEKATETASLSVFVQSNSSTVSSTKSAEVSVNLSTSLEVQSRTKNATGTTSSLQATASTSVGVEGVQTVSPSTVSSSLFATVGQEASTIDEVHASSNASTSIHPLMPSSIGANVSSAVLYESINVSTTYNIPLSSSKYITLSPSTHEVITSQVQNQTKTSSPSTNGVLNSQVQNQTQTELLPSPSSIKSTSYPTVSGTMLFNATVGIEATATSNILSSSLSPVSLSPSSSSPTNKSDSRISGSSTSPASSPSPTPAFTTSTQAMVSSVAVSETATSSQIDKLIVTSSSYLCYITYVVEQTYIPVATANATTITTTVDLGIVSSIPTSMLTISATAPQETVTQTSAKSQSVIEVTTVISSSTDYGSIITPSPSSEGPKTEDSTFATETPRNITVSETLLMELTPIASVSPTNSYSGNKSATISEKLSVSTSEIIANGTTSAVFPSVSTSNVNEMINSTKAIAPPSASVGNTTGALSSTMTAPSSTTGNEFIPEVKTTVPVNYTSSSITQTASVNLVLPTASVNITSASNVTTSETVKENTTTQVLAISSNAEVSKSFTEVSVSSNTTTSASVQKTLTTSASTSLAVAQPHTSLATSSNSQALKTETLNSSSASPAVSTASASSSQLVASNSSSSQASPATSTNQTSATFISLSTSITDQTSSSLVAESGQTSSSLVAESGQTSSSLVAEPGQTSSSLVAESGQTSSSLVAESGQTSSSLVAESGQTSSSLVSESGQTSSSLVAESGQTSSRLVAEFGQTSSSLVVESGQTSSSLVAESGQTSSSFVAEPKAVSVLATTVTQTSASATSTIILVPSPSQTHSRNDTFSATQTLASVSGYDSNAATVTNNQVMSSEPTETPTSSVHQARRRRRDIEGVQSNVSSDAISSSENLSELPSVVAQSTVNVDVLLDNNVSTESVSGSSSVIASQSNQSFSASKVSQGTSVGVSSGSAVNTTSTQELSTATTTTLQSASSPSGNLPSQEHSLATTTTLQPAFSPSGNLSSQEHSLATTTTLQSASSPSGNLSSQEHSLATTTTLQSASSPSGNLSSQEHSLATTTTLQSASSSSSSLSSQEHSVATTTSFSLIQEGVSPSGNLSASSSSPSTSVSDAAVSSYLSSKPATDASSSAYDSSISSTESPNETSTVRANQTTVLSNVSATQASHTTSATPFLSLEASPVSVSMVASSTDTLSVSSFINSASNGSVSYNHTVATPLSPTSQLIQYSTPVTETPRLTSVVLSKENQSSTTVIQTVSIASQTSSYHEFANLTATQTQGEKQTLSLNETIQILPSPITVGTTAVESVIVSESITRPSPGDTSYQPVAEASTASTYVSQITTTLPITTSTSEALVHPSISEWSTHLYTPSTPTTTTPGLSSSGDKMISSHYVTSTASYSSVSPVPKNPLITISSLGICFVVYTTRMVPAVTTFIPTPTSVLTASINVTRQSSSVAQSAVVNTTSPSSSSVIMTSSTAVKNATVTSVNSTVFSSATSTVGTSQAMTHTVVANASLTSTIPENSTVIVIGSTTATTVSPSASVQPSVTPASTKSVSLTATPATTTSEVLEPSPSLTLSSSEAASSTLPPTSLPVAQSSTSTSTVKTAAVTPSSSTQVVAPTSTIQPPVSESLLSMGLTVPLSTNVNSEAFQKQVSKGLEELFSVAESRRRRKRAVAGTQVTITDAQRQSAQSEDVDVLFYVDSNGQNVTAASASATYNQFSATLVSKKIGYPVTRMPSPVYVPTQPPSVGLVSMIFESNARNLTFTANKLALENRLAAYYKDKKSLSPATVTATISKVVVEVSGNYYIEFSIKVNGQVQDGSVVVAAFNQVDIVVLTALLREPVAVPPYTSSTLKATKTDHVKSRISGPGITSGGNVSDPNFLATLQDKLATVYKAGKATYNKRKRRAIGSISAKIENVTLVGGSQQGDVIFFIFDSGKVVNATYASATFNRLSLNEMALMMTPYAIITPPVPAYPAVVTESPPVPVTQPEVKYWIIGAVLGPLLLLIIIILLLWWKCRCGPPPPKQPPGKMIEEQRKMHEPTHGFDVARYAEGKDAMKSTALTATASEIPSEDREDKRASREMSLRRKVLKKPMRNAPKENRVNPAYEESEEEEEDDQDTVADSRERIIKAQPGPGVRGKRTEERPLHRSTPARPARGIIEDDEEEEESEGESEAESEATTRTDNTRYSAAQVPAVAVMGGASGAPRYPPVRFRSSVHPAQSLPPIDNKNTSLVAAKIDPSEDEERVPRKRQSKATQRELKQKADIERLRNKQRLREQRKAKSHSPEDKRTWTRTQQSLDDVLDPRDPFAKNQRRKGRKSRKVGSIPADDEGIELKSYKPINREEDKETEDSGEASDAESDISMEETRRRMHSLLEDAFSLLEPYKKNQQRLEEPRQYAQDPRQYPPDPRTGSLIRHPAPPRYAGMRPALPEPAPAHGRASEPTPRQRRRLESSGQFPQTMPRTPMGGYPGGYPFRPPMRMPPPLLTSEPVVVWDPYEKQRYLQQQLQQPTYSYTDPHGQSVFITPVQQQPDNYGDVVWSPYRAEDTMADLYPDLAKSNYPGALGSSPTKDPFGNIAPRSRDTVIDVNSNDPRANTLGASPQPLIRSIKDELMRLSAGGARKTPITEL
ncbi:serine-rich adhesin for platelets isoform X2 [Nematostella vectensis]|uniref:serine-rich adhesin for platelets isoform X2 n=1 Tax=Nematostella vectensis TaxID=45351 RepID=UPI0020770468|nr:serine-rich adhesin for platelets isoform X2 [Nematostella vectensis]